MLFTLGELEGFITSHACVIVGDFNDFILEFDLLACDLNFRPSVCYTYESCFTLYPPWLFSAGVFFGCQYIKPLI